MANFIRLHGLCTLLVFSALTDLMILFVLKDDDHTELRHRRIQGGAYPPPPSVRGVWIRLCERPYGWMVHHFLLGL